MAYNKFITKKGTVLLDLTPDSVTSQDVRQGIIFHGRDGKEYIGALADGVIVDKTEINADGELVITYSDNTIRNLGKVIGPAGASGKDGANGTNGKDGVDGTGVQTATIDEAGNLSMLLTNGNVVSLGNIKGKDGANGTNGKDGINGIDGKTPYIKDGYWWIGETNTNVKAEGVAGVNGKDGTNGKDYVLTETDLAAIKAEITQMVIESLGGNPIFGYVDKNKNIVLSGNVLSGDYTIKYEMENGSTIDIGNLVFNLDEPDEPVIVNLFKPSTATYNARLGSDGTIRTDAPGAVVSDYIDVTSISKIKINGNFISNTKMANFGKVFLYDSAGVIASTAPSALALDFDPNDFIYEVGAAKEKYTNATQARFCFGITADTTITESDVTSIVLTAV